MMGMTKTHLLHHFNKEGKSVTACGLVAPSYAFIDLVDCKKCIKKEMKQ